MIYRIGFIRYIDEGKNPQLYTKDCLEKALAQNKQVKGKVDSYKVPNNINTCLHKSLYTYVLAPMGM